MQTINTECAYKEGTHSTQKEKCREKLCCTTEKVCTDALRYFRILGTLWLIQRVPKISKLDEPNKIQMRDIETGLNIGQYTLLIKGIVDF